MKVEPQPAPTGKNTTVISKLDRRLLLLIQHYRPKFVTQILLALTKSGTGRAWLIWAAIFNGLHLSGVRYTEDQNRFLRSLFAPLLAWILSHILKRIFARRRPYAGGTEGLAPLIQAPTCGSFPSGHAAASFAFFIALMIAGHPLAPLIGSWAVLVSFSRIYLGVHYLSDVVGGIFVGLLSAIAISNLV